MITSNRTPFKKSSALTLSILMCALIIGLALFHLFIHDSIFVFLGFFIFTGLFIGYIVSLIKSICATKLHKKPLLINLLTPVALILIIWLDLPVYMNFHLLYPGRIHIIQEFSKPDALEKYVGMSHSVFYLEGLKVDLSVESLYVYFKTKEEFLLSGDLPYDTTSAHEGFEYSESGVFKESDPKIERIIYLGTKWRYVRYERQYNFSASSTADFSTITTRPLTDLKAHLLY